MQSASSCVVSGDVIYQIIQNTPLEPQDLQRIITAYEQTLLVLGLKDRDDSLTRIVAQKIFEVGQTGIEDPAEISKLAMKQLGIP